MIFENRRKDRETKIPDKRGFRTGTPTRGQRGGGISRSSRKMRPSRVYGIRPYGRIRRYGDLHCLSDTERLFRLPSRDIDRGGDFRFSRSQRKKIAAGMDAARSHIRRIRHPLRGLRVLQGTEKERAMRFGLGLFLQGSVVEKTVFPRIGGLCRSETIRKEKHGDYRFERVRRGREET